MELDVEHVLNIQLILLCNQINGSLYRSSGSCCCTSASICVRGVDFLNQFDFNQSTFHVAAGFDPDVAQFVMPEWRSQYINRNQHIVCTFFFLSAFLATYLIIESLKRLAAKKQVRLFIQNNFSRHEMLVTQAPMPLLNWLGLSYLNRYLRITPIYLVFLLIFTYVLPYLGQGPLWGLLCGNSNLIDCYEE